MNVQHTPDEKTCSSWTHLVTVAAKKVYAYISFSSVGPLIAQANETILDENAASKIQEHKVSAHEVEQDFERIYRRLKEKQGPEKAAKRNLVFPALIIQFWSTIVKQLFWTFAETAAKIGRPIFLRIFLIWLKDYKESKAEHYEGWIWGLLLCVFPFLFMVTHHRFLWFGTYLGYKAKLAMIAAVHSKLLKLNSSAIGKITTGHVVNLVSNDVQRFELSFALWPYLIYGPIETIIVLFLISSVIGFLPAISGLSCTFLLVPLQSLLSKKIAKYRKKIAETSDRRINLMGEVISGSLAVKMLGWEDPLLADVKSIRNKEVNLLKQMNYIRANAIALSGYILPLTVCVSLVVFRFTGDDFSVPDVFFVISLLNLPKISMAMCFNWAVQQCSELLVSTKRLDKFFKISEPEPIKNHRKEPAQKGVVSMENGVYGWFKENKEATKKGTRFKKILNVFPVKSSAKEEPTPTPKPDLIKTLTGVSFNISPGELVGIAGTVGSGKSSFLAALLNDMVNLNPRHQVELSGSVAYCSQVPWIIATTVKENILFGKELDQVLYKRVLSACELQTDLQQFPYGDQTEIGERGINLSGGQKARLALARAAYSQATINLLDDPLSAVDPKVGKALFEKCIGQQNGLMKNSTRILVTHQRQFLPLCDRIILMKNGKIECTGTWNEVAHHHLLISLQTTDQPKEAAADSPPALSPLQGPSSKKSNATDSLKDETHGSDGWKRNQEIRKKKKKQLVQAEAKETGRLAGRVYWEYILHIGLFPLSLTLLTLLLRESLFLVNQWWIAEWASTDVEDERDYKWIWVLISLTASVIILTALVTFSLFSLLVHGSTRLHAQMVLRVLHAPLRFFHTNPTGRILNRFSKDLGMQDDELPKAIADSLLLGVQLIGTLVLVLVALPYVIPLLFPIVYIFWKIRQRFTMASLEIKRFDGTTRSPVYAMFSSNIRGLTTIRAYEKEHEFQQRFLKALELNGSWVLTYWISNRWYGFRLDGISSMLTLIAVIGTVIVAKMIPLTILALALTNLLNLSGTLQWCMRLTAEVENAMTAVERNLEYSRLEQEPPKASEGGGEAPENWPMTGNITYSAVTASYRPGLEPVLNNLSFKIPGGSSVGIVGRTGSGKSSLLLALFRLIDINTGQIFLDGIDISSIGIDVLRKQLAVIPQDPMLFGGTLRSNLDPWNGHSDGHLWKILKDVCLEDVAQSLGGLSAEISECGNNFSVGQRQLLCLARALIAESKILALDEATANVDHTTDALIQNSLRSLIAGNDKTLLIIAHRIDTIMDCDLILVLEDGRKVEFGSPSELLQRPSRFKKMVDAARSSKLSKERKITIGVQEM